MAARGDRGKPRRLSSRRHATSSGAMPSHQKARPMHQIHLGDVTITSIIERDGPWRAPEDMFPAYDRRHRPPAPRMLCRRSSTTPPATAWSSPTRPSSSARRNTPSWSIPAPARTRAIPAPMDFPKQPWLDGFAALGLKFDRYRLRVLHPPAHRPLRLEHPCCVNGRWVPTFPNAKYVFHQREYAAWEEATARGANPPGNVWTLQLPPDRGRRPGAAGR